MNPLQTRNYLHETVSLLWITLSVFHFPVIDLKGGVAEGEAIGLYDLFVVMAGAFFLLKLLAFRQFIINKSVLVFFVVILYFVISCLLNIQYLGVFSFLLIVKHFEYLIAIVASFVILKKVKVETINKQLNIVMVVAIATAFYTFFSGGHWNVQLPYAEPNSGALFGAVLAAFLVKIFVFDGISIPSALLIVLVIISIIASQGRTQVVGAVVAVGLILTKRYLLSGKVVGVMTVSGFAIFVPAIAWLVYDSGYILTTSYGVPFQYITDIGLVLADDSFQGRISIWAGLIGSWGDADTISFVKALLFGEGIGRVRYVDGLYVNILYSVGVVGWIVYFGSLWLLLVRVEGYVYFAVFLGVSAITGELIVQSYRFVQILIPILVMMHLVKRRKNEIILPVASCVVGHMGCVKASFSK